MRLLPSQAVLFDSISAHCLYESNSGSPGVATGRRVLALDWLVNDFRVSTVGHWCWIPDRWRLRMDETEATHYYCISARCVFLHTEQRSDLQNVCVSEIWRAARKLRSTIRLHTIDLHCFLMNAVNKVLLILLLLLLLLLPRLDALLTITRWTAFKQALIRLQRP
jgi:hypothetical protein